MKLKTERQTWMATLAKAQPVQLEKYMKQLGEIPQYEFLRRPEIGLAMVRGRAGGTGEMFNLGEMTIVRCVVQIEDKTGFGYVGGRSRYHAEMAAVCDALLQDSHWQERVLETIIKPLDCEDRQEKEQQDCQTEATKVDFFTLLRGE
ncbi:MAG: phosphonate C-P lyase system protein PhnG [Spirulinaceae cyanobacterium]